MIIHTERDAYECASAEQYLDGVHLLNDDGSIFVIIAQPERIQKVEGGEIVVAEQPEPTDKDRIAALEAENAMLMECLLEMSEIVYA